MMMMMRMTLVLAVMALPFPGHTQPPVAVEDPWVMAAPPGATVMAGYMTLVNNTRRTIALVGASSPQFERVELHRSSTTDGVARMEAVASQPVRGNQRISLEPGGLHLMLVNPKVPTAPGDIIELDLRFDNGWIHEMTVPIRRAGQAPSHQP